MQGLAQQGPWNGCWGNTSGLGAGLWERFHGEEDIRHILFLLRFASPLSFVPGALCKGVSRRAHPGKGPGIASRLYHDSPALRGVSISPASYTNEETEWSNTLSQVTTASDRGPGHT